MENYATEAVRAVKFLVTRLTLANANMEAVLKSITVSRWNSVDTVISKPVTKCLRVTADARELLEYACIQKAFGSIAALTKILPKVDGPKLCRRMFLVGIVFLVFLEPREMRQYW